MDNNVINIMLEEKFKQSVEDFRKKWYAQIPFEHFLIYLMEEGLREEAFWRDIRSDYCYLAPICKAKVIMPKVLPVGNEGVTSILTGEDVAKKEEQTEPVLGEGTA